MLKKLILMEGYFQFENYPLVKDEILFSYDIKAGLLFYKCLIDYSTIDKKIIIRDYCFDTITREIIMKDPLKQLNNFKYFLTKKFKLTTKDRLGWHIGFSNDVPGKSLLLPL